MMLSNLDPEHLKEVQGRLGGAVGDVLSEEAQSSSASAGSLFCLLVGGGLLPEDGFWASCVPDRHSAAEPQPPPLLETASEKAFSESTAQPLL